MKMTLPSLRYVLLMLLASFANASDTEFQISVDCKQVVDLSRLRLMDLRVQAAAESIVVARIRVAEKERARVDEEQAHRAPAEFSVAIDVLEVLMGDPPPRHWEFVKSIPVGVRDRGIVIEPYRMPGTWTAVIEVSTSNQKMDILGTFPIPTDWRHDVVPAMAYINAHRKWFDSGTDASGGELRNLLRQENSLLAIAAAQALSSDPTAAGAIMDAAGNSRGFRQGALAFISLTATRPQTKELLDTFRRACRIIERAPTTEDIHGFALAVRAASKGIAKIMTNAILLGAGDIRQIDALSAADRLQPLLISELRDRGLALDPEVKDHYFGVLVGIRLDAE